MNGSLFAMILIGTIVYLCAMSAVGRWLARSRELASVAVNDRLGETRPAIVTAVPAHERIAS